MQFDSIIVPNLKVDVSNYLTEILMTRKNRKMPKCEFWRKEYSEGYESLKDEYVLELTAIKAMLKVFSPDVVVDYIKSSKITTVRFLRIDYLKDFVYGLFKKQVKYIDSLEEISKSKLEFSNNKLEFIENSIKQNNVLSKGL